MIRYRFISAICLSLLFICLPTLSAIADEYWDRKVSLFNLLPIESNDIVFLGNSITDGGEFNELFKLPNIKNRGIRSDIIPGVEKRLDQILSGRPAKLFLLIGINDVSHGHSVATLASKYQHLVDQIKAKSPETRLYIQSVMPVNNDFKRYKGLFGKEETIVKFNEEISKIAEKAGATYIDLTPVLSDNKGKLRKEFTNDGLHLTGKGYRAWADAISSFVME